MKICIAQTTSVTGDISANIIRHKELIALAAGDDADAIIFPELSICGYEPPIAVAFATQPEDNRFNDFQFLSNAHRITIGIGVPLNQKGGVAISMLIFQPERPREVYSKKYLHEDEEPFFVSGKSTLSKIADIALAICYEISIPAHAKDAAAAGAQYYLASVAKTVSGVEKASTRLSLIAREYGMPVLMTNCIGPCEGQQGGGKSAVWNTQGELISQLTGDQEGLIIFDTETGACQQKTI